MSNVLKYSFTVLVLYISSTICVPSSSCRQGLVVVGTKDKRWKLCVKRTDDHIQIKIVNLFEKNYSKSQALALGLPRQDKDGIIGFLEIVKGQAEGEAVKLKKVEKMNCTKVSKEDHFKRVTISCHGNLAQSSKSMVIYYSVLESSDSISSETFMMKSMMKSNKSLTLHFHEQPPSDSDVTNVPKNYGKSMALIVGIAVLLTTLITVTVCCCCKRKHSKVDHELKTKDVSVAFYRDNGEVGSESSDEDENVAFIQKNHDRNSNV